MASTHAIKARIKGVESIRQITKSMKLVAASKLRRAQEARGSLAAMAEESRRALEQVCQGGAETDNPFLTPRAEKKRVCFVLFVGNRGLCGVYNSAALKFAEERLRRCNEEHFLVVCGSWGQDIIEGAGISVRRRFSELSDMPRAKDAEELTEYLKQLYLSGQADEIVMVYQKYYTIMRQKPEALVLLPVSVQSGEEAQEQAEEENPGGSDYIFEPDRDSVLEALVELYISSSVFSIMLDARTGEHAARMTSMNSAAESSEEMLEQLRLELNHARQAAITTEISEIVGGAQALSNHSTR